MTDPFYQATTWSPANLVSFTTDESSPSAVVAAHIELVLPIGAVEQYRYDDLPFGFLQYFQASRQPDEPRAHVVTERQRADAEDAELSGVTFGLIEADIAPWAQDPDEIDVAGLELMIVRGTAFADDIGIDDAGRCIMSRAAAEAFGNPDYPYGLSPFLYPLDADGNRTDRSAQFQSVPEPFPIDTRAPATVRAKLDDVLTGSATLFDLGHLLLEANPHTSAYLRDFASPLCPNDFQRTLAAAYLLELEVRNGGLLQFLDNHPYWRRRPARALDHVGLRDLAAAYSDAVEAFQAERVAAIDEQRSADETILRKFDTRFYGEDLDSAARAFVAAHIDAFIAPA